MALEGVFLDCFSVDVEGFILESELRDRYILQYSRLWVSKYFLGRAKQYIGRSNLQPPKLAIMAQKTPYKRRDACIPIKLYL